MYVGITRAQRSLHLSFCRKRKRAGEPVECQPSRFLAELAQEDLALGGRAVVGGRGGAREGAGSERLEESEGDARALSARPSGRRRLQVTVAAPQGGRA